MPEFRFHLQDGVTITDVCHATLNSAGQAKAEALRCLGRILEAYDPEGDIDDMRIVASDKDGLTLFSVGLIITEAPALGHAEFAR